MQKTGDDRATIGAANSSALRGDAQDGCNAIENTAFDSMAPAMLYV